MSPISSDENVINILESAHVTNQSNGYAEMKYVFRDMFLFKIYCPTYVIKKHIKWNNFKLNN